MADLKSESAGAEDGIKAAQLLELAFDAVFVRDFHEPRITFWNRGAERLYGWTRDEAMGQIPAVLLRSVYPQPLAEIEATLLSSGRWEGEMVQTDRSGRQMLVNGRWALRRDSAGQPVEILEINSDITDRKRAETELRESEERFRLLVEGVRDYAIFMLDPGGYISSWNRGAQRINGYTADEAIGKHLSLLYPLEGAAEPARRELEEAVLQGSFAGEGWRRRKNGTLYWAHITLTALRDEKGVLRGYAKVTRDMTEQRRAEVAKLAAERGLAVSARDHAERLAALERAKSNFLNLASHELRAPLTVLIGYLSLLEEGALGDLNPAGVDMVPVMQSKAAEMNRLVDRMLEVARLEDSRLELHPTRTNLVPLVVDQVARFDSWARANHEILTELPSEPVYAHVDSDRVALIVSNLIDNAIKYSPEGGRVSCRLDRDGPQARIVVEDTGIGISSDELPILFTRFGRIATPDTAHISGTGLGLYLCRELAHRHGGTIDVESERGRGSRFTLRLPCEPVSAAN